MDGLNGWPLYFRILMRFAVQLCALFGVKNGKHLFVVHNKLCYEAMLPVMSLLMQQGERNIYFTLVSECGENISVKRDAIGANLQYVAPTLSCIKNWSTISFADHHYAKNYSRRSAKILFYHGIDNNASGDGGYQYSRDFIFDSRGRLFYDIFFESSEALRRSAIAIHPELSGKIHVVGSVWADEIFKRIPTRRCLREKLGLNCGQIGVVVGGAYGSESTWNLFGRQIRDLLSLNREQYKFFITAHPHIFSRPDCADARAILNDLARLGITILQTREELYDACVACDFAISDYSSVTVLFLIAGLKPMFVPLRDGVIQKDSLTWRVYEKSVKISFDLPLTEQLSRVANEHRPSEMAMLCHSVVDKRNAGHSMAKIILSLT